MGFMFGKSSAEPSLKLHLLQLEMQPLYQDVKICDLELQTERRAMSKLLIYIVIIPSFSIIYCIGIAVAVLNRNRSLIFKSRPHPPRPRSN